MPIWRIAAESALRKAFGDGRRDAEFRKGRTRSERRGKRDEWLADQQPLVVERPIKGKSQRRISRSELRAQKGFVARLDLAANNERIQDVPP